MQYVSKLPPKNFSERRKTEVRRKHTPRTPVNKGKKKGRGCYVSTPHVPLRYLTL